LYTDIEISISISIFTTPEPPPPLAVAWDLQVWPNFSPESHPFVGAPAAV